MPQIIEGRTMRQMVYTQLLPAIAKYQTTLANTISSIQAVGLPLHNQMHRETRNTQMQ